MPVKRLRQLLVTLHVLTSVAWLTMAVAQVSLMLHAISSADPGTRRAALTMTEFVDHAVLQPSAATAAYTGLMLSALTSWGFFRFGWVAVKFVVTFGGIGLGIGYLGQRLHEGVLASEQGGLGPVPVSVRWAVVVVAALVVATWLSVAKPGGRLRRAARPVRAGRPDRPGRAARPVREPDAHPAVWVAALAVPVVDYAAGLNGPLMLLTVVAYAVYRGVRDRSRGTVRRSGAGGSSVPAPARS